MKNLAIDILAGKKEEPKIDETKEAMYQCAQGILNAISDRDTVALKEHLYSFLELYSAHEGSESPEEEASEYDRNIAKSKAEWS